MPKKKDQKDDQKPTAKSSYGAKDIQVLEGLKPVRKRPGMYIGSTGIVGLHHLIWEIVDNSIDEAMAGHADTISITIQKDGVVMVEDNGRGIPVDTHPITKKSALETIMTTLHAGGKFGGGGYKVSGGLHGVGASVVNALSSWMRVEVGRDGKLYSQEYKKGEPATSVKKEGTTTWTGTRTFWKADPEIFDKTGVELYDWKTITDHLRQQAYLTKGIRIKIVNEFSDKKEEFYYEGGIKSYVEHLNEKNTALNTPPFYVDKENGSNVRVEIAVQYNNDFTEELFAFANNIFNPEGGTHVVGFRTALTRTINNYAKKHNLIKESGEALTGDDVREGLTAVISIKLPDPQFEGQTKAKLGNADVRTIVDSVFSDYFSSYLEEHPADARRIINKTLLAAKARLAARAARDTVIRKGVLEGMTLPGKLADCSEKDPAVSEIYIVEGDSAGGCFDGDTKVALTDGRNLSFKNLVQEWQEGKTNYCYTIKEDGNVGIEKIIYPRVTNRSAEVIEVVLDNNETITCTPDHKFMLRDGSYIRAEDIEPTMSLMPFYEQERATLDKRNNNLMRLDSLIKRFFGGEKESLLEAVKNYNHKVKRIEKVTKKTAVYDIEVPHTHNFALASGVFVHNSAKQGRDRRFQAILPLRGKILNVERARLDKMLLSEEIKNLIIALGMGIGDQFDVEKTRYERIIIMTDADVDGAHIRTLLMTFFYRYMRAMIDKGFLYIARPPLYLIKKGKVERYAYTDEEKDAILAEIKKSMAENKGKVKEVVVKEVAEGEEVVEAVLPEGETKKIAEVQRYKGLGEMNPDQLWATTMDPQTRMMYKVTIEDAIKADEMFKILMGDEVAPRKDFIQTHAKYVENLDI